MVIGENTYEDNEAWSLQARAAGARYADSDLGRRDVEQDREKTKSVIVADAGQISARFDHLRASGELTDHAIFQVAKADSLDELAAKERMIGTTNESQGVNFLARGVRAANTVARINLLQNGIESPQGTGSLVSPRLLLTNNHVLPDIQTANEAFLEFGAELNIDNKQTSATRFQLDPDAFFVTDVHLDFTLVLVAAGEDGRTPGDVVGGWNHLIAQQGKIVVGESMNIIGHPSGRLKAISIRENRLDQQLDEFLHYKTDTEPGNSGSPVFNDQWEVVALHHSGVPKVDAQGRRLRRDGTLWHPGDGDAAVDWIANEGVRISVILEHLAGQDLDQGQRETLAELGPTAQVTNAAPDPESKQLQGSADTRTTEAVGRRVGIKSRPTAFGGQRHLLFLHGRGQEGRDPEQLRRTWTAGLNQGLTLAGKGTIDPADVYFPFYGDVLVQPPEGRESILADSREGGALYNQIVDEAAAVVGGRAELQATDVAANEGIGEGLKRALQNQLSLIAARSGLDDFLISRLFKDVAAYLDNDHIRSRVLETVMEAVPTSGRLTLVSHSLGTVVAMDLLTRLPAELDVELLVTAGSPLGLDSVYNRLLSGGAKRPERVGYWLNAWYPGDPVAIGCPLKDSWHGQLQDERVENTQERAHDIAEYLAHPAVAKNIGERILAQ